MTTLCRLAGWWLWLSGCSLALALWLLAGCWLLLAAGWGSGDELVAELWCLHSSLDYNKLCWCWLRSLLHSRTISDRSHLHDLVQRHKGFLKVNFRRVSSSCFGSVSYSYFTVYVYELEQPFWSLLLLVSTRLLVKNEYPKSR